MSNETGCGAGDSNNCTSSGPKSSEHIESPIVENFNETLEVSALFANAERVRMFMNYANVEGPVSQFAGVEIEKARQMLEAAKLRVMHSSIESIVDLAIKVLVAGEDGFQSKEINSLLTKGAQRIVATA